MQLLAPISDEVEIWCAKFEELRVEAGAPPMDSLHEVLGGEEFGIFGRWLAEPNPVTQEVSDFIDYFFNFPGWEKFQKQRLKRKKLAANA